MRFWLVAVITLASCGHPPLEQPVASACVTDTLQFADDSSLAHSLVGKYALKLVTSRDSRSHFEPLDAELTLGTENGNVGLLGGLYGMPAMLMGTATIPREPFPTVELPIPPSAKGGVQVGLLRDHTVFMEIGGASDWPNFNLNPNVFGARGFAGVWVLQWIPARARKNRRAWGTFCAIRKDS